MILYNRVGQTGNDEPIFATLTKKGSDISELEFSKPIKEVIELYGNVPLPPYIKRKPTELDSERYQTVYADLAKSRSVAAPTAGLHFDENILKSLESKGLEIAKITLNVGMGTFKPIKEKGIKNHKIRFPGLRPRKIVSQGASWTSFGTLLGALLGPLGLSWVTLGLSWVSFGNFWVPLGALWDPLGSPLRPFGILLDPRGS